MRRSIIQGLVIIFFVFCLLAVITASLVMELSSLWGYFFLPIFPFTVLLLYTIFYVKNKILQPIQYLRNEAKAISTGDLSRKITHCSNDEIGDFISAFEDMRKALYEQQKQQEQFELSRKDFIDSISHDLKTPLSSISAYVEAFQDGLVSTKEEEQAYLKVIENKIGVLTELSQSLSLSYETPASLPLFMKRVNCCSWSGDFLKGLELDCASKGIYPTISNEVTNTAASMVVDVHQLDRALNNIVSNAFRYYQTNFIVTIALEETYFVLTMENDGIRLAEHELNRIFDRFYTKERMNENGHLGIGLYISKTIINSLDGEIKAEMTGGNIRFIIKLPYVIED